jgi:mannose/fructose/N-acetylgalactosamine-specific phosphotransferase system component IIC
MGVAIIGAIFALIDMYNKQNDVSNSAVVATTGEDFENGI